MLIKLVIVREVYIYNTFDKHPS